MGAEGYGIYFMLLERLRDEPNYTSVKDYNMLAFDLRVGSDKVKKVVENFGLFVFTEDGKHFYSEGFSRRMQLKDQQRENAKKAAETRWIREREKQSSMRAQCERNARKVKERNISSPNVEDIPPQSPLSGEGASRKIQTVPTCPRETKEKVARKRKALDLSSVEPSFQPIVADWLSYKSERGQTYRQRGFDSLYARLLELSKGDADLARKIIQQSMANNWAGLFPLKTTNDYVRNADDRGARSDITGDEFMRRCEERVRARLACSMAREMGADGDGDVETV